MIIIKTPKEIEIMQEGGKILAEILSQVSQAVKPGITTNQLNKLAEELILKYKARPSFKGFQGYPASLCASIDEEVVHALPGQRKLKEGNIIGLDLGIFFKGYCTDAAVTVAVGKIKPEVTRLLQITKKALEIGLNQIKPGHHISDIGSAIQKYVEKEGFNVVRQLVGHGVGKKVHEDPQIPNFGQPGKGPEIKERMTLAIEPMVTIGRPEVEESKDGYGFVTKDKSYSAHFEHTVAVTKGGYLVLTK